MPSENKTANIGLNQWQANEYPKREDFNADNLAIDEALGGKLSKTGDGKDVTVNFTEAMTRENIVIGEPLKVILGKVSKFFRDLKAVAFTGSYNNLGDKPNDENLDVCEDTKTALGLTQPEPKIKDALINAYGRIGDIKNTVHTDLEGKWLLCNGDILDKTNYPELYNLLDYKVVSSIALPETAYESSDIRVACNGNTFVIAVIGSGAYYTSDNANGPWTKHTFTISSGTPHLGDVLWDGSNFVFLYYFLNSDSQYQIEVKGTSNFVNWHKSEKIFTKRKDPDFEFWISPLSYINNKYVFCLGNFYRNITKFETVIIYSDNFLSGWSANNVSTPFTAASPVRWLNNMYIMIGYYGRYYNGSDYYEPKIVFSQDLQTWSSTNPVQNKANSIPFSEGRNYFHMSPQADIAFLKGHFYIISVRKTSNGTTYSIYKASAIGGEYTLVPTYGRASSDELLSIVSFDDNLIVCGRQKFAVAHGSNIESFIFEETVPTTKMAGWIKEYYPYKFYIPQYYTPKVDEITKRLPAISPDTTYTYIRSK